MNFPLRPAIWSSEPFDGNALTESRPQISVVIPAYNSEAFIRQAIQSVLAQSYTNHEIIVVDDGSSDDTQSVLGEFGARIKCLCQPNRGCSAARNAGILAARGEFICFLDADDEWVPEKLELQAAFMERHPEVGLLFADEDEIEAKSGAVLCRSLVGRSPFYPDILKGQAKGDAFSKLIIENFIPTSTVMIRRECFFRSGIFDETLRVSEDRDLWSRIAATFAVAFLPQTLGRKRVHPRNISSDSELTLRSRLRVWEKARRLFPEYAEVSVIVALVAEAQLQLSCVLLAERRYREALCVVLQSVWQRAGLAFRGRATRPLVAYSWWRAVAVMVNILTPSPLRPFLRWAGRRGRKLKDNAFAISLLLATLAESTLLVSVLEASRFVAGQEIPRP